MMLRGPLTSAVLPAAAAAAAAAAVVLLFLLPLPFDIRLQL